MTNEQGEVLLSVLWGVLGTNLACGLFIVWALVMALLDKLGIVKLKPRNGVLRK